MTDIMALGSPSNSSLEGLSSPVRVATPIAGESFVGAEWMTVYSPYSGKPIAQVPACGIEDVERACRAANSFLTRAFPQFERAAVLTRAAQLLRERVDEFARIIVLEAGKPVRTARTEVERCIDTLTLSAAETLHLSGEMVPMDASASGLGRVGFAVRVPIGVVAAITPFNFPLNLVAHKVAPAIAAGCPIVLKPAPATPLSALAFADLLAKAGLPNGWLSVLTGSSPDLGKELVQNSAPRLISFTGSVPVGWSIAAAAPRKRVCLELGANSPVIIDSSANIPAAARRVVTAAFSFSGQACISVQRVLVHQSVADEFIAAVCDTAKSLVVGDPLDESTDVGPVINGVASERISTSIRSAESAGATVLIGGEAHGNMVQPTILSNVPLNSDVWRTEIFGPVMAIETYDDLGDAIALANDSDFGLHVGVFTNDLSNALRAAKELEFGGVLINDVPTARFDQQPYGGIRDSGNTREGPHYAIQEMTELRFVSFASQL